MQLEFHNSFSEYIHRLLIFDPAKRIRAVYCLSHPFINCTNYQEDIGDCKLQIPSDAFEYERHEFTLEDVHRELLFEGW